MLTQSFLQRISLVLKQLKSNTINVYDVMKYNTVIATKAAVKAIEEVYA